MEGAREGAQLPWLSIAVTAVILGALFLPGSAVPKVGFDGIDLVAHLVLFGCWGAAVAAERPHLRPWQVVAAGLALALATEGVQAVIPGRAFSGQDVVADLAGLVLGAGVVALVRRLRGSRAEPPGAG